ncbi:DUF692 domain-containing protein [Vibrio sp. Of7-15]|uniref:MNIO family bufferin maturase n=1 Tax=Vibrio sp. Of7-15 TaxID=2724879 RepID=UPI001EF2FEEB|nr:DUF692 domain-containing protein [Vibrio sp. Of7-15]MCG7496740.1 DUF692 domain-containing protein [Vibrio sp. Of7-15]
MTTSYHSAVGVGLRHPHIPYFLNETPSLSWLEIHSENYFEPHSPSYQALRNLAQRYEISCHGIGLSLGSVDPINQRHVQKLKTLIHDIEPIFVSDHLSWSSVNGQYFNDLLPLPYTEEALNIFCRNLDQVQHQLDRQLLIENPSSYLRFEHSTIPEWEFLSEVQRRTDCRLLLDFNNIHVSAFNHGFSAHDYVAAINPLVVDEIHLAGFTIKEVEQGEIWLDTHSKPVTPEVWQLYQNWVTQHGPRRTLIEWDSDIPEPEVLLNEALKASRILTNLRPHKECV